MTGKWINGSGWVTCLFNAEAASSCTAKFFITAANIEKKHYAHEVTSAAHYSLTTRAHREHLQRPTRAMN